MSEHENMYARIEEKIRALGDMLVAVRTENAALKDEVNRLQNIVTDLEEGPDNESLRQGSRQSDQVESVKKELDKYINEVEHCIELVKQL